MTITTDYHVHSTFSSDGHDSPEAIVKHAIDLGLTQICFTEHNDFYIIADENKSFILDIPSYFAEIERLQKIYGKKIKILHGIEAGLYPCVAEKNKKLIDDYNFDFVIGSSHMSSANDPYYPSYWDNKTEEEGFREYFQTILECLNTYSDFDAYGHLDYVVRYSPSKKYSYDTFADIIDEILKKILSLGKIIEINSSPIRSGLPEPNPSWKIVKRYKELGGEAVTIGSDSHYAKDLAKDFEVIEENLINLGFKYYALFEGRKVSYKKL